MGFNNAGLEAMAARLERLGPRPGIVGANIGMNRDAADPVADYRACLCRVYPLVDYITVNVSSPNTPGLRALQQEERLRPLLDALLTERERLAAAAGRRPILLKVSPDLDEAGEEAIAAVVDDFRIDGLIVGNTTVSRPSGLRSRRMAETGGLSGRPLFLPSTRLLARFAARLGRGVTLVAAGGVSSGADAYEKVRAGASVVQIYTGLVYRGLGIVRTVLDELEACLARDGFATLADAVGRDSRDSRP
jgi:dihydroorotate dehydrogenase